MSGFKKTYVAIFNQGGGMRGLIPAHIMAKIEEATGRRMSDMVDFFAGPSTGSILNAALNVPHPDYPDRPKYKAKHLVRFYEREGLRIFPQDRFRSLRGMIHDFNNRTMRLNQLNWILRHGHYDSKNLLRALKLLYGRTGLQDSLSSLIIPVYNIDGEQIEVVEEFDETGDAPVRTMNNFMEQGGFSVWLKNIKNGFGLIHPREVSLVDSVMASCAAPSFFPCHHFPVRNPATRKTQYYSGIDGSIFDNPCISYHGAIRSHLPPDSQLIMIMLGTGYTNKSIKKSDWNQMGALGVVDPMNDLPLINIFFHASETALMQAFSEQMQDRLFIFNKSLYSLDENEDYPSTQIDDASPENLARLKKFADGIIEENRPAFDRVCDLLTKNAVHRTSQRKGGLFGFLTR